MRELWLLLVLICWLPEGSLRRSKNPNIRHWKGMETNTGRNMVGWLLQISNPDGGFACCGSYYATYLVLSSASCMEPYRWYVDGTTVEGTAYAEDEIDNYSEVDVVYIPREYRSTTSYMDIAVIKIRRPIPGRMTEFIQLCSAQPEPGTMYRVFAWGYDSIVIQDPSIYPRTNMVPLMELEKCKSMFAKESISETVLCVKQPMDRRNCLYDGGSPLVYNNKLCGIASYGSSCQNTSVPGIFTDILKVKAYISTVENEIADLE